MQERRTKYPACKLSIDPPPMLMKPLPYVQSNGFLTSFHSVDGLCPWHRTRPCTAAVLGACGEEWMGVSSVWGERTHFARYLPFCFMTELVPCQRAFAAHPKHTEKSLQLHTCPARRVAIAQEGTTSVRSIKRVRVCVCRTLTRKVLASAETCGHTSGDEVRCGGGRRRKPLRLRTHRSLMVSVQMAQSGPCPGGSSLFTASAPARRTLTRWARSFLNCSHVSLSLGTGVAHDW